MKNFMKKFFCKLGLRVVDLILDVVDRHNAASSGKVPQSAAAVAEPKVKPLAEAVPEPVALVGGGLDGHVVPGVPVLMTAVLLLRDAATELWWTYDRQCNGAGIPLRDREGRAVYADAQCVGKTGMSLLKNGNEGKNGNDGFSKH